MINNGKISQILSWVLIIFCICFFIFYGIYLGYLDYSKEYQVPWAIPVKMSNNNLNILEGYWDPITCIFRDACITPSSNNLNKIEVFKKMQMELAKKIAYEHSIHPPIKYNYFIIPLTDLSSAIGLYIIITVFVYTICSYLEI